MDAPKKRATRIAAPGARRVAITGLVAAADGFGRVRLLLLERTRDGAPDPSWAALRGALGEGADGRRVPFRLWAPDAEGVRGEVWLATPARLRPHWLARAAALRGREARAEALVRPYRFAPEGEPLAGVALDLVALEPREARAGDD